MEHRRRQEDSWTFGGLDEDRAPSRTGGIPSQDIVADPDVFRTSFTGTMIIVSHGYVVVLNLQKRRIVCAIQAVGRS